MIEQHFSVRTLARLLDMSDDKIWRAVRSGELKSTMMRGSRRIPKSAVEEWLDSDRAASIAPVINLRR